jgi:hypothetical protein
MNSMNDVEWCYSFIYREISVNLKEYKTKLYFTMKVPVIKIDNNFNLINHRNFDRISEPFKVQKISLFSASCPFGKMSVRQTVRSAKRPFGNTSVGKMSVRQNVFRQNVFRQSVFRQNVRPPSYKREERRWNYFLENSFVLNKDEGLRESLSTKVQVGFSVVQANPVVFLL